MKTSYIIKKLVLASKLYKVFLL